MVERETLCKGTPGDEEDEKYTQIMIVFLQTRENRTEAGMSEGISKNVVSISPCFCMHWQVLHWGSPKLKLCCLINILGIKEGAVMDQLIIIKAFSYNLIVGTRSLRVNGESMGKRPWIGRIFSQRSTSLQFLTIIL